MHATNIIEFSDGFVRADAEVEGNIIKEIRLTGEMDSNPPDFLTLLQRNLKGVMLDRKSVSNAVNVFYLLGMRTSNVTKEQLVELILGLAKSKGDGKA